MNRSSPMTIAHLTFDAVDKHALGRFWSHFLEWDIDVIEGEVSVHSGGDSTDMVLLFMNMPEEKRNKNRCHPDVQTENLDAALDRAKGLDAVALASHQQNCRWVVLQDPEGNEFCLVEHT